jgi:hypothetical protein
VVLATALDAIPRATHVVDLRGLEVAFKRIDSVSGQVGGIVHVRATASRAPAALRHDDTNFMAFGLVGGSEMAVGSRCVGHGRGAQQFQPRLVMAAAQIEPRRPV